MLIIFIKDFVIDDNLDFIIKAGFEGELLDDSEGRIKVLNTSKLDFIMDDGEVFGVQPSFYIPVRTDLN